MTGVKSFLMHNYKLSPSGSAYVRTFTAIANLHTQQSTSHECCSGRLNACSARRASTCPA